MMSVYIIVTGVVIHQYQFEVSHIFEVVETTIDKVDGTMYKKYLEKYGSREYNGAPHILRLITCYRDIMPPMTGK